MSIQDEHLTDRTVVDPTGEKIGTVTDVVFDSSDLEPTWLVVDPGRFKAAHYVPVVGAEATDDGAIRVPYASEVVRSSPKASSDHVVTESTRSELCDHYHIAA
jgi:sporulation protein YlmC with PRC-barrel domain